jgi:hypothetical protein
VSFARRSAMMWFSSCGGTVSALFVVMLNGARKKLF